MLWSYYLYIKLSYPLYSDEKSFIYRKTIIDTSLKKLWLIMEPFLLLCMNGTDMELESTMPILHLRRSYPKPLSRCLGCTIHEGLAKKGKEWKPRRWLTEALPLKHKNSPLAASTGRGGEFPTFQLPLDSPLSVEESGPELLLQIFFPPFNCVWLGTPRAALKRS